MEDSPPNTEPPPKAEKATDEGGTLYEKKNVRNRSYDLP